MNLKEKVYEIIESFDRTGETDECAEEIEKLFIENSDISNYEVFTDTDVFDSCGLDIFYVSVAWVDVNNKLHICGSRLTSC